MAGRQPSLRNLVACAPVALGVLALLVLFASMTLGVGGSVALATLPTPTPTFTPVPPGVIDFSARIEASGTNSGVCDSSGAPTFQCDIAQGSTFVVGVYLHALPSGLPGGNYDAVDVRLDYSGVASPETNGSVDPFWWPGCALKGTAFLPGSIRAGCVIGPGASSSSYTGLMVTAEFTCTAGGSIQLVHGTEGTQLYDEPTGTQHHEDDGTAESLAISCVSPLAYPGDTDDDRCPDANEAGLNPMLGGQRNFLNRWDYFNPTYDGENRVDDIMAVVQHFAQDAGSPDYSPIYDRTYIGPNPWNLGPPDGQIRVPDILASVRQFRHDCS